MGIPKYCDIKVPVEYLQDYKDAFDPDYKYISAWNPNESGDDDKPVTPCATPSVSYESGKLKFSCETVGAEYHYTISDTDIASDAYSKDGNVSLSAAYDISVYATADGYSASEKTKATLYWVNANLENTTNINQARTRGVVASAMMALYAFRVLIMARWLSSMQLMASLSTLLLPWTVPHPALYQKPWLLQNSVTMQSRLQ